MKNYKLITLIAIFVFGLIFSIPSFTGISGPKINLGLDLQGGMYIRLEVKTEAAVSNKLSSILSGIKYFADKNDVLIDKADIRNDSIEFVVMDESFKKSMDSYLANEKNIEIKTAGNSYRISFNEKEVKLIKDYAIKQAIGTIKNRLDQFGLAEPVVTREGINNILVELPGIKTREDEERARKLIARSAKLRLMAVDEDRIGRISEISDAEADSFGDVILRDKNETKYLLKKIAIIDGSMLEDARVAFDRNNMPVINFTLDSKGADIFGSFSGKSVGKRMAIVVDDKVYSAPSIRERIGGGKGQISGSFTLEEATDIAISLRSGALPAPVKMVEKRSIGPSLGEDSISSSVNSLILGFVLVVLFMILYYGMAGVIASVAVCVNLVFIVAMMAIFGATLTLPGMAGIILTVGMSVDANIIINERIREFLRRGDSVSKALVAGYENAARAIYDANVTTIIAAVILYAYGTSAIKGFAITMSIGIIGSVLTSIIGTQGMYDAILHRIKDNKNYKFLFGMRKA